MAAVEAWLAIRERKKGPLFVAFSPHGELRETRIEGRLVAEVVKRLFRDAGASPNDVDAIGAHSLRRGVDVGRYGGGDNRADHGRDGHRDPKSLRRYTAPRAAPRSKAVRLALRSRHELEDPYTTQAPVTGLQW